MAALRAAVAAALMLVLACGMVMEARAQACPAATSYLSCQSALTTMNTMPTGACCAKVAATLQQANGPKCLCDAMTSPTAVAFKVIKSQAILLPSKCETVMGLKYAKGYNCGGAIVP